MNLTKEIEYIKNEMPPLLDNYHQQEEFSNTSWTTKVDQINQVDAIEHESLSKIQIPWDMENNSF